MEQFIKVVLKKEYQNDLFILVLNHELVDRFGANDWDKFNPWYLLEAEANYLNVDRNGLKQLSEWQRPVTAEILSENFSIYRNGEWTTKITHYPAMEDIIDAIAIAKWIASNSCKHIDRKKSKNYQFKNLKKHLNHYLEEKGITTDDLWRI